MLCKRMFLLSVTNMAFSGISVNILPEQNSIKNDKYILHISLKLLYRFIGTEYQQFGRLASD